MNNLHQLEKLQALTLFHKQGYQILQGVYFLYEGNKLQYIGKSNNIISRTCSHHYKKAIPFDRVEFLISESERERSLIEYRLIKKNTPPFNKTNRRSKNVWRILHPQLRKEERDRKSMVRLTKNILNRKVKEAIADGSGPINNPSRCTKEGLC